METPFISFIIPCYNVSRPLLEECVSSIVTVHVDKEIIIINDGSDEAVEPLSGTQVYDIPHAGLAAARNYGLEVAKGKYIQFVDADDKLFPETYQKIIDVVVGQCPDMFYFDFSSNKECGQNKHLCFKQTSGAEYMHDNNIHGSAWAYLFRKSLVEDLRFTDGILHEDEEFTPQLLLRAKMFLHTHAKAYFYRYTESSIMRMTNDAHIKKRLDDMFRIILSLQNKVSDIEDFFSRQALERRINQLCMDYLYNVVSLVGKRELKHRKRELQTNNLYPLPVKSYTWKYAITAVVTHILR